MENSEVLEGVDGVGAEEFASPIKGELIEVECDPDTEVIGDAGDKTVVSLANELDEQDRQAQRYALEFFSKVIRLRSVKIERVDFLRQELHKIGVSDEVINSVLETTPAQAGVSIEELDSIALKSIAFESKKAAAISFAAGIPGGLTMLATVPADVTQYYVHAFRVMQKLAYIYGWQDLLGDLDNADDDTLGRFALFLGVMMGVGGAANSLSVFASQVAQSAVRKHIASKALTKTVWYPVVKQTLKIIGVTVTKDTFAKTVAKAVPIAGGLISGGMTLASLKAQAVRLQRHLRELPPPGVDAAAYLANLQSSEAQTDD